MRYKRPALLALLLAWTGGTAASEFCDGFKDGYRNAYQSATGMRLQVILPVCPVNPGNAIGGAAADYYNGVYIGRRQAYRDYATYQDSVSTHYGNIARTWNERDRAAAEIRKRVIYPSYTLQYRR